jgi:hypothetical protein
VEALQEELSSVAEDLDKKVLLLQGISHVAAQDDSGSGPSKKRARGPSPASAPRPARRVHFQEAARPSPGAYDGGGGDDGWGDDDSGASDGGEFSGGEDEGKGGHSRAMVVHAAPPPPPPPRRRARARAPAPLVEEASDSDDGQHAAPAPRSFGRKPAPKPAFKPSSRMAHMLAGGRGGSQDSAAPSQSQAYAKPAAAAQAAARQRKPARHAGVSKPYKTYVAPPPGVAHSLFRGLTNAFSSSPDASA